jgi:hypothetical protein
VRTTTRTRLNERVATRAVLTALVLLALAATQLVAQRAPSRLTLEEAITLAKGNNPLYLSTQNDMAAANWQTREAYAAFLPRSMSVALRLTRRRAFSASGPWNSRGRPTMRTRATE